MNNAIAKITPEKKPVSMKQVRVTQRQMRYLAQSALLEEAGTSSLVRMAMLTTCAIVLIFLVWSNFTHVDELAPTLGEVIPTERVKVVQHLEGGIVKAINVEEGELVEADQVLLVFEETPAKTELEKTRAREFGLMLKAERLRAFAEGREPDFGDTPPEFQNLQADQQQIYAQQLEAMQSARAVVLDQIAQRRAELRALEEQRQALFDQADILSQQLAMREELLQKGLTSKLLYLQTKQEHSRVLGDRKQVEKKYKAAEEALAEVRSRLVDLNNSLNQDALTEMGAVTTELAQVREALAQLDDRMRRLSMRSPVRGRIQGLKIRTIGAVVPPGGVVMEVVPEGPMLVETRILSKDRGHVTKGQDVNIKVTTFDYARFGSVSGKVEAISPTTYIDEKTGEPYFKGIVTLDANYVGDVPGQFPVQPGMTVQADIITGNKTIMQYLLKPIYVGMHQSFTER